MHWRKSSLSQGNGQCVEIGTDDGPAVAIRNSKAPDRGTLTMQGAGFAAFVDACRAGELDDLTV